MQHLRTSLLVLLALCAAASAQLTFHVPNDQPTIATAIAIASTGDTVLVAPGTYFESSLSFLGKAITVRGEGPMPTVIDLQGASQAFAFTSAEGPDSVLEDITIIGGGGAPGSALLIGSSPTVRRCSISATGGVAILVDGVSSSPAFEHCTFAGNATVALVLDGFVSFTDCDFSANLGCIVFDEPTVIGAPAGSGLVRDCRFSGNGGLQIRVLSAGVVEVEDCEFTGNLAIAIETIRPTSLSGPADVCLRRCLFQGNVAGAGGTPSNIVRSSEQRLTIEDCDFLANTASRLVLQSGIGTPGVLLRSRFIGNTGQGLLLGGPGVAESCVFVGNASPFAGAGAAVGGQNGAFAVRNCTFAGNSSASGAGGLFVNSNSFSADIVQNCILVGNSGAPGIEQLEIGPQALLATVSFCNVESGFPGTGNIDVDPMFADLASGDVHLATGSPCIDAGDPNVTALTATDFDGDPRVLGAGVDIGADEVGAVTFPGTVEDLRLETEVNEGGNVLGAVKPVAAGDLLTIALRSPGATFDFAIPLIFGQPFTTGSPPSSSLPGVQIDVGGSFVFLLDGLGTGPLGPQLLPPGGVELLISIPTGLTGVSVLVQGAAISPNAQNGFYATTDAHELRGI